MTDLIADLPPEEDPVQVRRVRPADVHLPAGHVILDALVIVTRHRLYAWSAGPGGGVQKNIDLPHGLADEGLAALPSESRMDRDPMRLTTTDGEITVVRRHGCGCGSPLARFKPWEPERSGT
jgi:hypothetical protein